VLRFDMGKTFEVTDQWAGEIGLPMRRGSQTRQMERRRMINDG
jgi:hypothetical protein